MVIAPWSRACHSSAHAPKTPVLRSSTDRLMEIVLAEGCRMDSLPWHKSGTRSAASITPMLRSRWFVQVHGRL